MQSVFFIDGDFVHGFIVDDIVYEVNNLIAINDQLVQVVKVEKRVPPVGSEDMEDVYKTYTRSQGW